MTWWAWLLVAVFVADIALRVRRQWRITGLELDVRELYELNRKLALDCAELEMRTQELQRHVDNMRPRPRYLTAQQQLM